MSEYSAKTLRDKMKAKARSLSAPGSYAKDQEVSSADWSPAEPLNTDAKTGMRPISKRSFKKGGSVAGSASKPRADRKARKSGGRTVEKEIGVGMANKNMKQANEQRDGVKHIGGLKKGGKVAKKDGGSIPTEEQTLSTKKIVGSNPIKPKRGAAGHYDKGGKAKKAGGGSMLEKLIGKPKTGSDLSQVGKMGSARYPSEEKETIKEIISPRDTTKETVETMERLGEAGRKKGGRAERKAGGRTRAKGKTNINIVISAGRQAGPETPPLDMAAGMPSAPPNMPPPPPMAPPGAPPPAAMPMGGMPGAPMPGMNTGGRAGKLVGGSMMGKRPMPPMGRPVGKPMMGAPGRPSMGPPGKPAMGQSAIPMTRSIDAMAQLGQMPLSGGGSGQMPPQGGGFAKGTTGAPPMGGMNQAPMTQAGAMGQLGAVPQAQQMQQLPPEALAMMQRGQQMAQSPQGSVNSGAPQQAFPNQNFANVLQQMQQMQQMQQQAGAGKPLGAMPSQQGIVQPPAQPRMVGRKAGGRIAKTASSYKDMEAGAGSGEGRLQKTDIAKRHHDAPARKRGGKVYSSYKDMDAGAGSGPGRLEKTEIEKKQRARGK